jgi:hypothetical protein
MRCWTWRHYSPGFCQDGPGRGWGDRPPPRPPAGACGRATAARQRRPRHPRRPPAARRAHPQHRPRRPLPRHHVGANSLIGWPSRTAVGPGPGIHAAGPRRDLGGGPGEVQPAVLLLQHRGQGVAGMVLGHHLHAGDQPGDGLDQQRGAQVRQARRQRAGGIAVGEWGSRPSPPPDRCRGRPPCA